MNLSIASLKAAYAAGTTTPDDIIETILARVRSDDPAIWITLLSREQIGVYLERLRHADATALPLYGIPFAIKDNIDLENVPTTAACPAYAYQPAQSAYVVQRLIDAGAIPVGKTNLDQFATGLVGTRSPYGVPGNAFDPAFISGGSSSGSAVAVARGLVSFALGTDTAGSGRVPAAFNNIFGLKPSCGLLSTSGVVPACRSLDCVSIFSLTAADAVQVMDVAAHFDAQDVFARRFPLAAGAQVPSETAASVINDSVDAPAPYALRSIGIPRKEQLEFFGDADARDIFEDAVARLRGLGFTVHEIDFAPFMDAARLLYEGPWVAERYIVVESLLREQPDALLPVTRKIIEGGASASAADAFRADYRLRSLRSLADAQLAAVDAVMTPTAGTVYRIAEVEADPVTLNSNLGRYTNFMNLLDFTAVAAPSGFRADGQPLGVTFFAAAGSDRQLLALAGRYHAACGLCQGALEANVPQWEDPALPASSGAAQSGRDSQSSSQSSQSSSQVSQSKRVRPSSQTPASCAQTGNGTAAAHCDAQERMPLVVCGAHMEGLALNHQLLELGALFVERTQTTPDYRFYRLGGEPARPALIRSLQSSFGQARAIEVEVWSVPVAAVGKLLAKIPAPLGLGKVFLADGRQEVGFIADATAADDAIEITATGGWRNYLHSVAT